MCYSNPAAGLWSGSSASAESFSVSGTYPCATAYSNVVALRAGRTSVLQIAAQIFGGIQPSQIAMLVPNIVGKHDHFEFEKRF